MHTKIAINDAYVPYFENTARIQIYFGGSSSGKSVFVAQRTVLDILKGERNYLVCRAVGRTLRKSVINQIEQVISELGVSAQFDVNKTDGLITCRRNGCQILFVGLDDTEKIKSIVPAKGVLTDIWVEEATEVDRDAIKQLIRRQRGGDEAIRKRLTMTFNPIYKSHWIYTDYFSVIAWADDQTEYQTPELSILKTTYKDNYFLTPQDVIDLESETDEYYRDVYTLGKWGILGDVIFKNWRTEDLSDRLDQFVNHRNGLDFGFSRDPAAIAATHYDRARKTIYIYGEVYERGLTNDVLAQEAKNLVGQQYIYCDSAEPKSIAELQQHGVSALATKKGKDSINFGIQWLQQQTIIVNSKCFNARNELSIYHWKKDKDGNAIRQPVDKDNHLMDSLRYAYEDETEAIQIFV